MTEDKTGGFGGRAGGNKETIQVSRKGRSPLTHSTSIVTFSTGNTARTVLMRDLKAEKFRPEIICRV